MLRHATPSLAAIAATFIAVSAAQSAELRILSAGAARSVMTEAIASYAKKTGDKIQIAHMPVGPIMKRLGEGATPDIVVLSEETMREAAAKNWIDPKSVTEVGRVGMGVAVRQGAPAPEIGTPDAFKKALLAAKSVVYVDPTRGTSGKHFASVLEKLGIAAEMKAKTLIKDGGYVAEAVAKGEAELAVHQITEILPVKGVKLVGPLPDALQKVTVYQAAAGAKTKDKEAVYSLLAFLLDPEIRALAVRKGFLERK